jgi:Flp pilus assembly protein TadG
MPSSARSDRAAARRDTGQATVELALCLPVVCLLLLGVVQVAVVVRDQLAVDLAARDAARAAAVSGDPAGSARAAARAAGVIDDVHVSLSTAGGTVTATVTHAERTDVPLIGLLIPDVTLRASATMVVEPP